MNILCIGDVVSTAGCEFIREKLSRVKRFYNADLCIVNGENSAKGNGITAESARAVFSAGADIITTGNHVLRRRETYDLLDENECVLRPLNYHASAPGRGHILFDMGRYSVLVVNLAGKAFMLEDCADPFAAADGIIEKYKDVKIKVFDFHAETTSEKRAMALYLDSRASVLFGTHTHVQTADEEVFPGGLGYITDLGMTGPERSVLGLAPDGIIRKFMTGLPQQFETSGNPVNMCGALFDVDESTGKCRGVTRISIK